MLAGCDITWKTTKQQTVAALSTEAENMALGDTVKELLWLVQLLKHIDLKFDPLTIFEDNKDTSYYPTIQFLTSSPENKTYHIDTRHYFISDQLFKKDFILHSTRSIGMAPDVIPTNFGDLKFMKFVQMIGTSKC